MSATGQELPASKAAHALLEAKFGAFLESVSQPIIVANSEGRIVLANELAERLFGYSPGELPGKAAETLLPKRFRGKHAFQTTGRNDRFGLRKDHSEFPIELSHKTLETEAGPFELSVILDLTERKQLEGELAEKTAALEAAAQEFRAFSYSISHDFRAPLRAVGGFAAMLKKSLGENLSKDSAHHLARIQENISKMSSLIDGLLDFSALTWVAMTKRTVHPADIAKTSFAELSRSNPGRQIDFAIGELPACDADAMLLRRVFDNLLSNALKFTGKCDPAVIRVGCTNENGEQIYFVQDNGVGFDMNYAGRLFQIFQRLHSASEFDGTGMGLAIVHRIVQRHGGRIWARAEVGRGATFYFTLGNSGYGHSA